MYNLNFREAQCCLYVFYKNYLDLLTLSLQINFVSVLKRQCIRNIYENNSIVTYNIRRVNLRYIQLYLIDRHNNWSFQGYRIELLIFFKDSWKFKFTWTHFVYLCSRYKINVDWLKNTNIYMKVLKTRKDYTHTIYPWTTVRWTRGHWCSKIAWPLQFCNIQF